MTRGLSAEAVKAVARVAVPSVADLYALPTVVDLPTAARFYGVGRDAAYSLHRSGAFPVPVLRLGRRRVVTRASLIAALDPTGEGRP